MTCFPHKLYLFHTFVKICQRCKIIDIKIIFRHRKLIAF